MKKKLLTLSMCFITATALLAQNVGIGTSSPAYKLDVNGIAHTSGDCLVGGYLGVNTTSPSYRFQVNDGSIAIFNTTDSKTWYWNYSSGSDYFQLSEGGINRLTVANGGNVGIGTTTPDAKLEVNGNAIVDGTLAATSNITTNGRGILSSWNGTQYKYYTQESSVHAVLPAFGTSIEGTIAWPTGIFSSPPAVIVGDITSTGGTVGQLFRVQMVTYDATNNNCHFRLINNWNGAVDYNITWNIILIGK